MSHVKHAARARLSTPCTASDTTFGGRCLNCGFNPSPEVTTRLDPQAAWPFTMGTPQTAQEEQREFLNNAPEASL